MPDLGIGIDGRRAQAGSRVVVRSLNDIRGAAGRTGQSIGRLDKRMKSAATTGNLLRRALTGIGAALLAREFVKLSDSFTNVENRLKLATNTTGELVAVQEELFAISQRSRSSFETNATLFNRLALSTKELGISLEETLQLTESLNQAVIISGASAQEASAGLIQLSQGLASNRLSGDELRSVLEQLPAVANVIAKELGITRGELKFFGEQGKLSADIVIRAFRNAREELAAKFGKTVPTIGQSFVILNNAAVRFVGNLNKGTGIATNFSNLIIKMAENFDDLAKGIGVVAAALGPLVLGKAIATVAAGLRGIALLALANPFTALAVGLTALVAAAIAYGDTNIVDELDDTENNATKAIIGVLGLEDAFRDAAAANVTFSDVTRATLQVLAENAVTVAKNLAESFNKAFAQLIEAIGLSGKSFGGFAGIVRSVINRVIGHLVGLAKGTAVVAREVFSLFTRGAKEAFDFVSGIALSVTDFLSGVFLSIKSTISDALDFVGIKAKELATTLGTELPDPSDLPFVHESLRIGELAAEAFLEGYNTDYVGAIGDFLLPQVDEIITRAGELSQTRLKAQADKLKDAAGTDLGADRAGGQKTIPPSVQKELAKLVEDTRTPLEEMEATLKRIQELGEFTRTAEEVTALGRAASQAKEDFIDAEFALIGLDDSKQILEEALTPLENYNVALARLQELLDEGFISQDLFNAAVANAKDNILGLGDVFADFSEQAAKNLQSAFADFLFNPFDEGLDGLAFKFAQTLQKMAAELLANQLLTAFFSSFAGGGGLLGGFATSALEALNGKQFGGPVQAGVPVTVGEGGRPEVFVPSQDGRVLSERQAQSQSGAGGANVNVPVSITNVTDPADAIAALETTKGQAAIMNVIRINPGAIKRALA